MRRWAIVVFVSLLFIVIGVTATCLIVFKAWHHEAVSLIRVSRDDANYIFSGELTKLSLEEYEVFRDSQADLIKTRFVMNAALRQPGIANLKWAKRYDDPADALEDAIEVESAEKTEVIAVSLRGTDKEEIKRLVNAVVQAYLHEVVHKDRVKKTGELERLRIRIRRLMDEIARKTNSIHELEASLARESTSLDAELQDARVKYVNQTLIALETKALQSDSAVERQKIEELIEKVGSLLATEKEKSIRSSMAQHSVGILAELNIKKIEVEKKKQSLSTLEDELLLREMLLESNTGIQVMHDAEIEGEDEF